VFLNTLFSLSEACLYAQLVDLLDAGQAAGGARLRESLRPGRRLHDERGAPRRPAEGRDHRRPERFVDLDEELRADAARPAQAGKKLFLATNSEWHYTQADDELRVRPLPAGKPGDWRELFDLVIVQARSRVLRGSARSTKCSTTRAAATSRCQGRCAGAIYRGGNAQLVQEHFGVDGEDILYVGDHVYADVHVSSQIRRWRTALVLRELETRCAPSRRSRPSRCALNSSCMHDKEALEHEQATLRLALQRLDHGAADADGHRPMAGTCPRTAARAAQRGRSARPAHRAAGAPAAQLGHPAGAR
jgi:5'-nucleotidase